MTYYCNPINLEYQYQIFRVPSEGPGLCRIHREAADPSVVFWKGRYYLFPSMSAGFYTSEDLARWERHEFLGEMPVYDYAPDVRILGEYLYCCASSAEYEGSFYRTRDPLTDPFEKIPGTFRFWDPNLFRDDDGRVYLYWGSSNAEPIYGIELDPKTMRPLGQRQALFDSHDQENGYERMGENHVPPRTEAEIQAAIQEVILGPFKAAKNNPYSYKPEGFITGAGHGSTFEDAKGGLWHISTMRISRQQSFERRLGLWRAEFDAEGELCCDQRYGDWPVCTEAKIWEPPKWMLLSWQKPVKASSGRNPQRMCGWMRLMNGELLRELQSGCAKR